MPVTRLLVEGKLDAEVLTAILAGVPAVEIGGSKTSLAARTKQIRLSLQPNQGLVCYLRDRDFDFDPVGEGNHVQIDQTLTGEQILGWRWRRHEIESYLLEPRVVAATFAVDPAAVEVALVEAGRKIAYYTAARWVIGTCRRSLPPHFELSTSPDERGDQEFWLPDSLDEVSCSEWTGGHSAFHFERIHSVLGPAPVSAEWNQRRVEVPAAIDAGWQQCLIWCSGKDLLAALSTTDFGVGAFTPGIIRSRTRDWIRANPEVTLELLPEWEAFRQAVREV